MEFFQTLFDWYMANLNYFTIALLMAIESTFLPLPSEVVIPFAAYKAGQGDLNVFIVVLMGTIGALTGSLINYTLAYYLGRPIVYKFAGSRLGKIFLLSEEKVKHAEEYFIRNGKTSTFIGRLVPGSPSPYFDSCRVSQNESPRFYVVHIYRSRDVEYYSGNYRILSICCQRTDIPVYRTYSAWSRCDICCLSDYKSQEKQKEILITSISDF